MKFSASAILSMLASMLVLASADSRQLKSRKGKAGKSSKKQPPGPPQPQPQCETIDLYYLLDYDNDCVKVKNPFEGREQDVDNALGNTDYHAIYGPPDEDGFFTDPPIGIKFDSFQDEPAVPAQYDGEMSTSGFYKLAAGFMLDPTPTRFVAAPDTLYRSSIWYQDYYYNDIDSAIFYGVNRQPIIGGSGKYACATGEIIMNVDYNYDEYDDYCLVDMYRLRICNTCPDPEEDYE